MSTADQQIADILAKYGEPIAGNIWRVQGQAVIYHKALERIAAQAGITFGPPTILRAERDEAVVLVTGSLGERTEWSIAEALVHVNYRVSGRQAAYVYAMAEKRAKDRVILKLVGLHGLLSSEYAACAPEVRLAGGEYVETPPDGAIRDGNLVTGFAWPAHPQWLSLFLAALGARVDIGQG
jgi:putative intracellular protease/amidase